MKQSVILFSILINILMSAVAAPTQYKFWLTVQGEISFNNQPLEDAIVSVYKNGNLEQSFTTNRKGKIVYTLHSNATYQIKVSKQGFITKVVDVDTTIPDWYQGAFSYWFDMDMVKIPIKEIAQEIKVGSVAFDATNEAFTNNWELTRQANQKINNEFANKHP